MKVSLVYPRMRRESFGSGSVYMPLGVLYIASYLKENGIDCNVIDCTFMDSWLQFEAAIIRESPDIIGVSFSSPLADQAFQAISISRNSFPNALIVVGGPHPTVDPENTIMKEEIDVLVIGEGEEIFLQIVKNFIGGKDFSEIGGIYYKKDGQMVFNDSRDFIKDLDKLPFPDRSLLDITRYIEETGYLTIVKSRGCVGNCLYCQPTIRKLFGNEIRTLSPERVIEDVVNIKENYYDDDNFILSFEDDVFSSDKEWVMEFCKLMVEKDLNMIPWWCICRVDNLDEEIIENLALAGCIGISFGVEFGCQRILDEMRKGIKVEQIKKAFHLCHKNSIITLAFLMIGAPSETLDGLEKTKKLVKEIHPDLIAISTTTPIIGSDLYDLVKSEGMLNIRSFSEYGYYGNEFPIKLNGLTREDLIRAKKELRRTYLFNLYKNFWKYVKIFFISWHRGLFIKRFVGLVMKK